MGALRRRSPLSTLSLLVSLLLLASVALAARSARADVIEISQAELTAAEHGDPRDPAVARTLRRKQAWDAELAQHMAALAAASAGGEAVQRDGVDEAAWAAAAADEFERALALYERLSAQPRAALTSGDAPLAAERMVLDDVIDADTCAAIVRAFADVVERGNVYPSFRDVLHGISLLQTLPMFAAAGRSAELRPVLRAREVVRATVQRYFNLSRLYIDATHVTRRNRRPDAAPRTWEWTEGQDHGIHADNCQNRPDGTCPYLPYHCCFWRDYSAILFLNEATVTAAADGGDADGDGFGASDFFFRDPNPDDPDDDPRRNTQHGVDTPVAPRCGRLVAFTSGLRNLHGVTRTVGRGYRYALASWLTVNEQQQEWQRGPVYMADRWRDEFSFALGGMGRELVAEHDEAERRLRTGAGGGGGGGGAGGGGGSAPPPHGEL